MNMHGIVSGAIAVVNPFIPITIRVSTGSTTGPDGTRTPTYATVKVIAQMQPLSSTEVMHLNGLNIQYATTKIYVNGQYDAISRVNKKGGDLVTTPDGLTWMISVGIESWPDWCTFAMTLQNDIPKG